MQTRSPAVAGMFYPGDAETLVATVEKFLERAPPQGLAPKAIIAPHAGYRYSGAVAGSAYAELRANAGKIQRVILIGPSHHASFKGVASVTASSFLTPLGAIAIDRAAITQAVSLGLIQISDAAHANEHSLEVHLPFVQHLFPEASIVPLLTGDADSIAVRQALLHWWGGDETLIVVSSDLSHYHDYSEAQRLDLATARKVEQLTVDSIGFEEACGATAINGLMSAATIRGLACHTLDLCNSGDTAGTRDRVVGYGAFALV